MRILRPCGKYRPCFSSPARGLISRAQELLKEARVRGFLAEAVYNQSAVGESGGVRPGSKSAFLVAHQAFGQVTLAGLYQQLPPRFQPIV